MLIHTYEVQFVEHGRTHETTVSIDAPSHEEARAMIAELGIVGRVQLARIRVNGEREILSRLDDLQLQLAKVTRSGIIARPVQSVGLGIWWAWLLGMAIMLSLWIALVLLGFLGASLTKPWSPPTPAPIKAPGLR